VGALCERAMCCECAVGVLCAFLGGRLKAVRERRDEVATGMFLGCFASSPFTVYKRCYILLE